MRRLDILLKILLAKIRIIEKPGNILLIHRFTNKARELFTKRRRNFDEFATFKRYYHGNVEVETFNQPGIPIVIAIFYTKFVCDSIMGLKHE
jgi:hypothetical protein